MKCSMCNEEAIGMTAIYWCTMHGEILGYEFRCKKHMHIKYVRLKQVNWYEIGD